MSSFTIQSIVFALAAACLHATPSSAQGAGNAGTACCVGGQGCNYIEGVSDSGYKWCASWDAGDQKWTQNDADVAKCIVDLHANQNSICITKSGSSCDINDSQIVKVADERLDGDHTFSAAEAEAFRAGIQSMADRGVVTLASSISIRKVADNGSAERGVAVFFGGKGC